jgi:hypothetical protein
MSRTSLVVLLGMLATHVGCATPQAKAEAEHLVEQSAIAAISQKTGMNPQIVTDAVVLTKTAYQKKGLSKTQAANQGVDAAAQKAALTQQQKNDLHAGLMRLL